MKVQKIWETELWLGSLGLGLSLKGKMPKTETDARFGSATDTVRIPCYDRELSADRRLLTLLSAFRDLLRLSAAYADKLKQLGLVRICQISFRTQD